MGGRDMRNIWRRTAKLDERQRASIGLRVRLENAFITADPLHN